MNPHSAAELNPLYGWNAGNKHHQWLLSIIMLDLASSFTTGESSTHWSSLVAQHSSPLSRNSLAWPTLNPMFISTPFDPYDWNDGLAWPAPTLASDPFDMELNSTGLAAWNSVTM